ncbi:MAG: nucleotidyl transferase AbiEii/AbiGii toxin family protein [Bacteroidetes bacterium]|nr:nucleotidyl transferase AbiEii/AbiGii toxin family protein [Bacteroidota bacterium]
MDIETLRNRIDREWGYRRAEELRVRDLKNQTHEQWLDTLPYVHYVKEPTGYLFQEAAELQKMLDKNGITFCFIGGVALQRWGEVRQTNDIDLTIFCELGEESNVLEVLDSYLESRIADTREMFVEGRMYLGHSPKGKQVDISIGFTPYEKRMMARSVEADFGLEIPLRICSALDLIVMKTVAGRLRDWADIQRIIQRSGETMDWDLVYAELAPLLGMAYRDENLTRLKKMVDEENPGDGSKHQPE